jgi:hypothetical protein
MWHPNNAQWWILVVAALLIVFVWPPSDDKSLAAKFVNWAVDPFDVLPILPDPLALGFGDDPDTVERHDDQVRRYDALYGEGGWTRKRLELKVATDPFNGSTERQILTAIGVMTVLLVWRRSGREKTKGA